MATDVPLRNRRIHMNLRYCSLLLLAPLLLAPMVWAAPCLNRGSYQPSAFSRQQAALLP